MVQSADLAAILAIIMASGILASIYPASRRIRPSRDIPPAVAWQQVEAWLVLLTVRVDVTSKLPESG